MCALLSVCICVKACSVGCLFGCGVVQLCCCVFVCSCVCVCVCFVCVCVLCVLALLVAWFVGVPAVCVFVCLFGFFLCLFVYAHVCLRICVVGCWCVRVYVGACVSVNLRV